MTTKSIESLGYAQIQRLRLIDFLLDQYGYLRRSAIMDFFGVSQPQASTDIKHYLELAPNNLVYNKHTKWYVRGEEFKRVWP